MSTIFTSREAKRKADNRYLWPAMRDVIESIRPSWVIGENVPNLIKMALPTIVSDLEAIRYGVSVFLIPAHGVGSPQRRRRAWIIAKSLNSDSNSIGLYREAMHKYRQEYGFELGYEQIGESGPLVQEQVWESIDPRVFGVADGVSDRLDRNSRLKGIGNSICPQVAAELIRCIVESEALKGCQAT
jgi:DNA (cytosine-5)-methyltransferase 1